MVEQVKRRSLAVSNPLSLWGSLGRAGSGGVLPARCGVQPPGVKLRRSILRANRRGTGGDGLAQACYWGYSDHGEQLVNKYFDLPTRVSSTSLPIPTVERGRTLSALRELYWNVPAPATDRGRIPSSKVSNNHAAILRNRSCLAISVAASQFVQSTGFPSRIGRSVNRGLTSSRGNLSRLDCHNRRRQIHLGLRASRIATLTREELRASRARSSGRWSLKLPQEVYRRSSSSTAASPA